MRSRWRNRLSLRINSDDRDEACRDAADELSQHIDSGPLRSAGNGSEHGKRILGAVPGMGDAGIRLIPRCHLRHRRDHPESDPPERGQQELINSIRQADHAFSCKQAFPALGRKAPCLI